jgi:protein-S-isoprenylcysteine O-methyltransferase Ste14
MVVARDVVYGLWIAWAMIWWAMSIGTKPVRRVETFASRLAHIVPLGLAAVLCALPHLPGGLGEGTFVPASWVAYGIGVALTAAGIGFALWARAILGGNWSGTVTVKEDHALVRRGPYGLVRHPIYTGMLLAFAGTAVCVGQWRALVAFALILGALLRKLRLEERWMAETFGDDYAEYRRTTPALVPFTR